MTHVEGNFRGYKDLSLYYQGWLPERTPRAILLVVHGLAEHSGRYKNVVDYFVPRGFAVYSFDLRGQGKSEGARCFVEHFSDYATDVHTFLTMVRELHPSIKIFLLGHSMGGTIAEVYAVQHQHEIAGLIVSGAGLKAGESITPIAKLMARIISVLFPRMGISTIDASTISRDKAVVVAYVSDPLVYRGKVTARLGSELINMLDIFLPARVPDLKIPFLIMHGTEDRLMNKEGSTILYNISTSPDKTLKFYDGFYHEIFNEPERTQVFTDIEDWIVAHI